VAFLFCAHALFSAVTTIIPLDGTWRYLDNGSNQGTNWTAISFPDGSWPSGPAELGYGDRDEATVVNSGNPNNRYVTTYFRRRFSVPDTTAYNALTLKVIRDDGIVVHFNGREVMRNNLPAGTIDFSTLASTSIDNAAEFTLLTTNLASSLLVNGTNVLAAEIHQFSRNDNDISFALELSATLNDSPTATLTSPTNGATFIAPASIDLLAVASDPDGPVGSVEFFAGTNRIGTASSPFNLTWSGVAPGTYDLRAVAVDSAGARGTSAVVNVTVKANLLPTVTVVQPTNGTVFVAPATVTIIANPADADGSISRVEFYEGDDFIGEQTNAPYALATTLPAGNYQFRVLAVDDLGAHSTPVIFTIIVRERLPPTVSLDTPTNNSVFVSPVDIPLLARATDPDGDVLAVDFYADNILVGSATNTPYSLLWTNAPQGSHTLRAVAVNDIGLRSTSGPVNILVRDNLTPEVFLNSPLSGSIFEASADITLSGTASDPDSALVSIELVINSDSVVLPPTSPFTFTTNNVPPGEYALYAIARDDSGTSATSAVVNVSVRVPTITRGPYLQNGTTNAVTVRWRTDLPTVSVVRCGTTVDDLQTVEQPALTTTEHEVRLTGLQPGTRYFYSIGNLHQTLATGPDYSFVTSPATNKSLRVWVLGDSGTANQNAAWVRDAYYTFNGTNDTDLWLMLGDNAYWTGLDTEFQHAVFEMYPEMLRKSVLWTAIGNHETYSTDLNGRFAYLDIFSPPTAGEAGGVPSGTRNYYSFDFANIHFVCLDSMTMDRTTNGVMLSWLREDLAANTNQWLIAYWHHPPYSKGSHDSDWEYELVEMRENAVPILESYGVDLVLCGHSHGYERSFLLDGHYGTSDTLVPEMIKDGGDGRPSGTGPYIKDPGLSPRQGAVYVVAGSSGQVSWGTYDHPAMFISMAEMGSLVLDIATNELNVKFLNYLGTVADSFTIAKGISRPVLELTSVALRDETVTLKWNSVPGARYRVERSSSLLSPDWRVIGAAIRAPTSKTTWSQPLAYPDDTSFYRVVQVNE
jgi:hypothetical protein